MYTEDLCTWRIFLSLQLLIAVFTVLSDTLYSNVLTIMMINKSVTKLLIMIQSKMYV